MNRLTRFVRRLELFELAGLVASIAAGWIFFHDGPALDHLMHQPGYHWKELFVIVDIYGHFIPWAVLAGVSILGVATVWLRRSRADLFARMLFGLRIFLAYCLLLIVFRVVNFYVPVLHPGLRDSVIQHMDAAVFGKQVSDWLEPFARPWLTGLLTGAYVSWFWWLFATVGILLIASREAATEYIFASLLAFYVGYVCYVLVPVIGPGYTLHYAVILHDIAPVFTMDRLQVARDCYPSLHTAISVVMLIYIWRYQRRWMWVYAPMVVLIILATLYLRFHYGMDDIAGLCLAVVVSYFAPAAQAIWRRADVSSTGIRSRFPAY